MLKKLSRISLIVMLVLTLACSSAMAFNLQDFHTTAQNKILYAMVDSANRQIKALVRIAQATPYDDVDWLLAAVDAIAAGVFAYADSIGATVTCTYVTYYIDGQYVEIDPLKVINVINP